MFNCPLLVPSPLRLNKQKRSTLTEEKTITVLSGHWTYPFNINSSQSLPQTHTYTSITVQLSALKIADSEERGRKREGKKIQENTAQ